MRGDDRKHMVRPPACLMSNVAPQQTGTHGADSAGYHRSLTAD